MYVVEMDLDGTLCTQVLGSNPDYALAKPIAHRIAHANEWFAHCHVRIKTGRGTTTGINWREVTECQLAEWGIRHDELVFRTDDADMRIDDKAYRDSMLDLDIDAAHLIPRAGPAKADNRE